MDRKKAQKSLALSRKFGRDSKESLCDKHPPVTEVVDDYDYDSDVPAIKPTKEDDDDVPAIKPTKEDDDEPGPSHIQNPVSDDDDDTEWEYCERKRIAEELSRIMRSVISNRREAENLAEEEEELYWRLHLLDISTHRRWDPED